MIVSCVVVINVEVRHNLVPILVRSYYKRRGKTRFSSHHTWKTVNNVGTCLYIIQEQ